MCVLRIIGDVIVLGASLVELTSGSYRRSSYQDPRPDERESVTLQRHNRLLDLVGGELTVIMSVFRSALSSRQAVNTVPWNTTW